MEGDTCWHHFVDDPLALVQHLRTKSMEEQNVSTVILDHQASRRGQTIRA